MIEFKKSIQPLTFEPLMLLYIDEKFSGVSLTLEAIIDFDRFYGKNIEVSDELSNIIIRELKDKNCSYDFDLIKMKLQEYFEHLLEKETE